MQTIDLIAKFLPKNFKLTRSNGILIKAINTPIGNLMTWCKTIAKPAVPPVAILFGDKNPATPKAKKKLPNTIKT